MKLMKKTVLTLMILSVLIFPVNGTGERSAQGEPYVPGAVPAGSGMAESMAPALHGMVLAMLNQDVPDFDPADRELAWESLYNMLSLYGQMDSRTQPEDGMLTLPGETAADYSAALGLSLEELGERPDSLSDRLYVDRETGNCTLACGNDGLAQLQLSEVRADGAGLRVSGALVYLVDGSELVRFEAELQPEDTMFGCAVTGLCLR